MAKRIVLGTNLLLLVGFIGLGITRPSGGPWGIAAHWMVTAMIAWASWVIATEHRPPRALWLAVSVAGYGVIALMLLEGRSHISPAGQATLAAIFVGGAVLMGWVARRHARA